jgi:transposase InsO family protein
LPHVDCLSRQDYTDEFDPQSDPQSAPGHHLTITDTTIENTAIPYHRTFTDDFIDDKLLLNSLTQPQFIARTNKMRRKYENMRKASEVQYPIITWTPTVVRKAQLADPHISAFIHFLEHGTVPLNDDLAKEVILSSHLYSLNDGVLYRLPTSRNKKNSNLTVLRLCLVVPKELRYDVLTSCHGDLCQGHFGIDRTFSQLQLKYYWKSMFEDCNQFVKSCMLCGSRKRLPRAIKGELHPLPVAKINQRWATDLVKMPRSSSGNEWILTFTEYSTRYVAAYAIPDAKATTIARIFVNKIVFQFGSPKELLSDLGANLVGNIMTEVCKLLKVKRLRTSPLHPMSDGLIEKFHSTLAMTLSMYVNDRHDDWDEYLAAACFAYNTSVCLDSTSFSPFFLMFGREPLMPLDTVLPTADLPDDPSLAEYFHRLITCRQIAKDNLLEKQRQMKERYDKSSNPPDFAPGDLIWLFVNQILVGGSSKFYRKFSGPYVLLEQTSPVNWKIAQAHDLTPLKNPIHVNRCKPFVARTIQPPVTEDLLYLMDENDPDILTVDDLMEEDRQAVLSEASTVQDKSDVAKPPLETEANPVSDIDENVKDNIVLNQPDVYEVEKIISGRYRKGGSVEYLVHWKGYDVKDRTWEPESNLNAAILDYIKTNPVPMTNLHFKKK